MIENSKKSYIKNKLEGADVKTVYRTVNGLLNNGPKILPTHDSIQCLSDDFALFFKEKVDKIQNGLEIERSQVDCSSVDNLCKKTSVTCKLSEFEQLTEDEVTKLINGFAAKTCMLDPIPTWFLKSNSCMFNVCISYYQNCEYVNFHRCFFHSA